MDALDQLTETDIARCLRKRATPTHDVPLTGYRDAGVLVPFVRVGASWHLLFIRRPASERDFHGGQVAFAGGKRDPEDADMTATALREAYEEVGIEPAHVQVLGQLCEHHSISRYRIAPTVGVVQWPYPLKPNPLEVARTFTIPLQWLAQPQHHEIHYRQLDGTDEPFPVVYFREYDSELLWGATARITLSLLGCLRG